MMVVNKFKCGKTGSELEDIYMHEFSVPLEMHILHTQVNRVKKERNNDCAVFVLFIIGLSLRNNKTIS